jgi:hypothetical protein
MLVMPSMAVIVSWLVARSDEFSSFGLTDLVGLPAGGARGTGFGFFVLMVKPRYFLQL